MLTIYHIRQPLPRGARRVRIAAIDLTSAKTLCGHPATAHDVRYSHQSFTAGSYVPCEQCEAVRANQRKQAR